MRPDVAASHEAPFARNPERMAKLYPLAPGSARSHPENTSGMAVETAIPEVCLSGNVLVSHTVPRAVPSALRGLTSGFGMEPGVSLSP